MTDIEQNMQRARSSWSFVTRFRLWLWDEDSDWGRNWHQATAVDLQWVGTGNSRQRAILRCGRTTAALPETADASWPESESQSSSQDHLQRCGFGGHQRSRAVSQFLRGFAGQRQQAHHGAPYRGQKDCRDCFDRLEKGGKF